MTPQPLRAVAATLGLFVAVYAPVFVVVSIVRPSIATTIPVIICGSLAIVLVMIFAFARRAGGVAEFGFRAAPVRYVVLAVLYGFPLAVIATYLSHLFPSASPIDTSTLSIWTSGVYFVIGASLQEEIIFRGLLQSFLDQRWNRTISTFGGVLSPAALLVAVLFGAIHAESGLVVAVAAFVLGVCAGEFRRRSGSLVPAVIIHALFNTLALIWP